MKFISSEYNEKTGISIVEMKHLGYAFIGTAKVHPDEVAPSKYTGCRYAEMRATIKALKYERELLKNKSDMAIDFMKSCESYAKFDPNSQTAKLMYRQINRRIKAVNEITDEINSLMWELEGDIKSRDRLLNVMQHKKEQRMDKTN